MSDKIYLLVCEGPTDIIVVKEIAKKISNEINNTIKIRELSPQKDATTARYPSHGWEEVRRWCRLYGTSITSTDNTLEAFAARRKNWKAELALADADGLIIQMDTDIVQFITDLAYTYTSSSKDSRKRFAEASILHWLGETNTPDEMYFLLSTQSTETWLLATHNRIESVFNDLPEDFDFEDIENAVERLLSLGYISYVDSAGKQKFSKSNYQPYAQKISNNLEKVCLECEEAKHLHNFLTT